MLAPVPAKAPPPSQPPVAVTFQPSFDCKVDRGVVEQIICADAGLASRDRILSDLYYKLVDTLPSDARAPLRAEQRAWLGRRAACGRVGVERRSGCIMELYDARIAELDKRLKPRSGPRVAVLERGIAVKPSFDCPTDRGAVEQAICSNPSLSAKDARMDSLYRQAQQELSGSVRAQLETAQRAWVKRRNACRGSDLGSCIERTYDTRLRELEAALPGR